jgi:hypothetical protein
MRAEVAYTNWEVIWCIIVIVYSSQYIEQECIGLLCVKIVYIYRRNRGLILLYDLYMELKDMWWVTDYKNDLYKN